MTTPSAETGLVLSPNTTARAVVRRMDDATEYHARASRIIRPPAEIELARANNPFTGLLQHVEAVQPLLEDESDLVQQKLSEAGSQFLRTHWAMLEPSVLGIDISFSLDGPDEDPDEAGRFDEYIKLNASLGFTDQATGELPALYDNFSATRRVLRCLRRNGLLMPGNVLADKHLPGFLLTAPVWYVHSTRHLIRYLGQGLNPNDYDPDQFVRYMARRLGTWRTAGWYQLFNRHSRPLARYTGDAIPAHLLRLIPIASQFLDYIVVATPHLDVVRREWTSAEWPRLVDPYLLGFSAKLPGAFFFLGRWSNTGLFPFAAEMVAATMYFLEQNCSLIKNFGTPSWVTSNGVITTVHAKNLYNLADQALEAYRASNLPAWLTEGRPEAALIATQ